jgi:ubiquinone/menaquinone biosynthesis C-methylase UbiE
LYVAPNLGAAAMIVEPALAATTERHAMTLRVGPLATCLDPLAELSRRAGADGVVLALDRGWPGSSHLRLASAALRQSRRVWFYFPNEAAVECVDAAGVAGYWRLWAFCTGDLLLRRLAGVIRPQPSNATHEVVERCTAELRRLFGDAGPVPLSGTRGSGMHVHTNFWVTASAGSELRVVTPAGVSRVGMPAPTGKHDETALLAATWHYQPILQVAAALARPSYIYERPCPGNFAAALVSHALQIPYIIDYEPSEILSSRSFNGMSLEYETLLARAEEAAFKQATLIVVASQPLKDALVTRKVDPRKICVLPADAGENRRLEQMWKFAECLRMPSAPATPGRVSTGDAYKEQVQDQWNYNPVGSHYATTTAAHTLEWFKEVEAYRYGQYAPWMPSLMEFSRHAGHDVLEIGGGMGTDLAQFAINGARVTDLDLSAGHLALARENFAHRGLQGTFIHHDAESLPFPDHAFDVVYANGVLHHTPNTRAVVQEIRRVLKPGGKAIVMMYAENSIHYWRELVRKLGLERGLLTNYSMGEIMSRYVEISQNDARPLVKVYTAAKLRALFDGFDRRAVYKRQLIGSELPSWLKWMPLNSAGKLMGWNVIIKAVTPRA